MTRPPIGASTFIWASPFTSETAYLVDRVADLGFDLIEICLEQPHQIDIDKIAKRIRDTGLGVTACGAFGPGRDVRHRPGRSRERAQVYPGLY